MHDLIRWADDLRHFLASSLNAQAVGGNTGAAVYWSLAAAVISYALWPKVRTAVNGWIHGHLQAHHDAIKVTLAEHHAAMKRHIAEEIGKLNK